jgi:hypothetical protein
MHCVDPLFAIKEKFDQALVIKQAWQMGRDVTS